MKKNWKKEYELNRERKKVIYIRVTENEYNKIKKRASKFPSLNHYMLHISLNGKIIERPQTITMNQYLELGRIGNNINQIARRINSSEVNVFQKGTKKELEFLMSELKKMLSENIDEIRKIID